MSRRKPDEGETPAKTILEEPPEPARLSSTGEAAEAGASEDPLIPGSAGYGMPLPAGTVVTGVRVRANRKHEHDGNDHPAGAEFTMSPDAAELSAARGDVDILGFNEEPPQ
jgi:hypothetical protein